MDDREEGLRRVEAGRVRHPVPPSLLTPQKTLPRWPLCRWSTAVETIVRAHVERIVDVGTLCTALNNAALIELHRGDLGEAEWLCRWQVEHLLRCSTVDAEHRARYVLTPIINMYRLQRHVDAEASVSSFEALEEAMTSHDEPRARDAAIREALRFSREHCRDDRKAVTWVQSVCRREALAALLRAASWSELERRLARARRRELDGEDELPAVRMVEDEARLLLGIHDGSVRRLDDVKRFARVPFVLALAQVAQAGGANEAGELDGCLELGVATLLRHSSLTRSAGEILALLVGPLAERHGDGEPLEGAIRWARRLQDEVLECQLLAWSRRPAHVERLAEVRARTQYWQLRRAAGLGRCAYPKHQFTRHLVDVA